MYWIFYCRTPICLTCFQICSMGFISGTYGGICVIMMFPEISKFFDLCHAAPSQAITTRSSSYLLDSSLTPLPLQTSYFYGFRLLACSSAPVFPDLQICLSVCSQLFRGHLKFQLFPYSFCLSLLILLHAAVYLHFSCMSTF